MKQQIRAAGIVGVGSYVPEKVLTNLDLEKMVDTNDEWIKTRTGISERRIAGEDQATSDLALIAAQRALDDAGLSPEDLDLIIVATATPDMFFPSTACIIQEKLGAKKAGAFDLAAACSGFIYGISVASQFIATGTYKTVLVVGAEALSKITDWSDRNTCVLFGDGAGAVVLQTVEDEYGVLAVHLGADGSGGELLKIPAGGSRMPASNIALEERLNCIKMAGSEVFKFAVKIMGEAAVQALESAGLNSDDIDLLIPHQANIRIIEAAAKRLGLPMEKVFVNVEKYGNTSAASIGIALDEAVKSGRIKDGDVIVTVGFGGGLTWAASVIRWGGKRGESIG